MWDEGTAYKNSLFSRQKFPVPVRREFPPQRREIAGECRDKKHRKGGFLQNSL
jgi:hypothetical protein